MNYNTGILRTKEKMYKLKTERIQIKLHGCTALAKENLSTYQGHNCQAFDVVEISETSPSGCMTRIFGIC